MLVLFGRHRLIEYEFPVGITLNLVVICARTRENDTVGASIGISHDVEAGDGDVPLRLDGEYLTAGKGIEVAR